MAKVLLVDTNFSSRPIFSELERLGHEVHVVGGNPSDCLAKSCSRYWQQNYADTDALRALIEKERFSYIVPGCTDRSYSACATVSEGRFPGISTVDIDANINQKNLFRGLCANLNLPAPRLQWKDVEVDLSIPEPDVAKLKWPLVVKPVDGFSGKGVTILMDRDTVAIRNAIQVAREASHKGKCLIEDYVKGSLHSHSAFLKSGQVVQDFVVKEDSTANPYVVDTSTMFEAAPASLLIRLRQAIETLATSLKLSDGLVHTQFILDGEKPFLIEVTRRCPGDLYSQLIELSGGNSYLGNYVRPFLGLPVEVIYPRPFKYVMRHTITVATAQAFSYLHFRQQLRVERWVPLSLTGDQLKPSPASRVGILFASAENEQQFESLYAATLKRKLYDVVA
jgi:formate-dependent phosphoribosylglycinamide formyltransferase (GAR transformylase)